MTFNRLRTASFARRSVFLGLTAITALFSQSVQAQDYGFAETPRAMTSVSAVGANVNSGFVDVGGAADDDNGFQNVALPFDFDFFGTTFTSGTNVRIFINGFVSFDTTATASGSLTNNVALSSANAPSSSVYLFWDDLDALSVRGDIFTHTQMNGAGNMEFVIEWNNLTNGQATANFTGQIVFEQTTNKIFLRYDPGYDGGNFSISYGLKSATGLIRGHLGGASTATEPAGNGEFTPAANLIDLQVNSPVFSASGNFLVGQTFDVSFTLDNALPSDSTLFDCALVLSTDAVIDSNDQVIGTFMGAQPGGQFMILGNGSQMVSGTFTLPAPNPTAAGRGYFLGILADSMATQVDLDGSDNSSSQVITVGPPLYITRTTPKTGYATIDGNPNTVVLANQTVNQGVDGEFLVAAPFDFTYFGSPVVTGADCAVGYNGYLGINRAPVISTTFAATNQVIPNNTSTTAPTGSIYLFWDDLGIRTANAVEPQILSLVSGSSPNRTWTIEFRDFTREFSATLGFNGQIVIEEGSGVIRFQYDENQPFPTGTTASIGLEDATGTDGFDLTGMGTSNSAQPATNFLMIPNGNASFTVDIVTSNVSVAVATANAGGQIDISRTFENVGQDDAGAFDVTFVLSDDNIFDSNDRVLNTVTLGGLSGGQTLNETSSVSIPTATPAGMYFVGVLANTANSVVLESDFFNNNAGTMTAIQVDAPGKDQGNVNGDLAIDVGDIMFAINIAISPTPGMASADVNNDAVVNILDIQILINRVINAP